jgi:hypothetical protein
MGSSLGIGAQLHCGADCYGSREVDRGACNANSLYTSEFSTVCRRADRDQSFYATQTGTDAGYEYPPPGEEGSNCPFVRLQPLNTWSSRDGIAEK